VNFKSPPSLRWAARSPLGWRERKTPAIGRHHKIDGAYVGRYASEADRRDDYRRMSNGEQFRSVVALVAKNDG
jgi:hypothetical protein